MAQAQLNGRLLDDGGLACEVRFEYGVGGFTDFTPWKSAAVGDTFLELLTDLLNKTLYQFRAAARNSLGTSYGSTLYFKTPVALPIITVQDATLILAGSATINGTLVDDGGEGTEPCSLRFEYGATIGYGEYTDWDYPNYSAATLAERIRELASDGVFHYRLQAKNSVGLVSSPDKVFRTMNADEYKSTAMDPVYQLILT